jgi:hypothetical protein
MQSSILRIVVSGADEDALMLLRDINPHVFETCRSWVFGLWFRFVVVHLFALSDVSIENALECASLLDRKG